MPLLYSIPGGEAIAVPVGSPVVVYVRRSSRRSRTSLYRRAKALRLDLHRLHLRTAVQYLEIACGRRFDDRPRLEAAIEAARERGLPVVTDFRNRYVRGPDYDGKSPTDTVSPAQWGELTEMAGEVPLLTLFDPALPALRVKAMEINRSDRAGRPRSRPGKPSCRPGAMKERRERLKPCVLRLRGRGESIRAIARRLVVPLRTVRRWLKTA